MWLSVQLGLLENLTLQSLNSCSILADTTQSSIYSFWKVSEGSAPEDQQVPRGLDK